MKMSRLILNESFFKLQNLKEGLDDRVTDCCKERPIPGIVTASDA